MKQNLTRIPYVPASDYQSTIGLLLAGISERLISNQNSSLAGSRKLSAHRKREELKEKLLEEVKGHNHPVGGKCGVHCPRNEHYKGPVKKLGMPKRK